MPFLTLEEYRKQRDEQKQNGAQPPQGGGSGFVTLDEYRRQRDARQYSVEDPSLTKETVLRKSGLSILQKDMMDLTTELSGTDRVRGSDADYQGIAKQIYDGTQQVWDYMQRYASYFSDEELEQTRATLMDYRKTLQGHSTELSKAEMLSLAQEKSALQKRVEAQQKAAEDGQWWSEQENAALQKELQDYAQRAYDVGSNMARNGLLQQGNWMNIWGSLYDFGTGAGQDVSNLASYYKSYYGTEGSAQEQEQKGKENLTFMTEYRNRKKEMEGQGVSPTQWFEKAKANYEKAERETGGWKTDKGHSQVWMDRVRAEYAYASFCVNEMKQQEVSQKENFGELSKPNEGELQWWALQDDEHPRTMDREISDLFMAVNRETILKQRDEHIQASDGMRDWYGMMQSEESYSESGNMPYGMNFERASYMRQEERDTFNYLVNTGATTEAKQYIQALMPYLKERAIQGNKEMWDDMSSADRVFMSFVAGLDNSLHFVQNWMTDEGYNADYNAGMSANLAEAGTWERGFRSAASSFGAMLPSMAVGGGMGGALMTLATAGGTARQQGLQQGMTGEQATVYGLLCGASEGGLQWAMGGIPGLKGALPEKLGESLAQNFSNVLARSAVKWAGNVGSELLEENVQNYLEPLFVSMVTNKGYEAPGWEEFLDTSLSVLILSGTLGGIEAVRNIPAEYADVQMQWAEQALQFPEDSDVYAMGVRVMENLMNGRTVKPSEWKQILKDLGADQKTMNQLRKGKLTAKQAAQIFGQRVMVAEELQKMQDEENGLSEQKAPDWGTYEAEHADRYTRDTSLDAYDQTGQFEQERDDAYYEALAQSDEEIETELSKWKAIRDDVSKDEIARDQAQHRLDAYELVLEQRAMENGGTANAEGIDDGGQRDAGMGTRGQAGTVESGTGRQVSREERATQGAVLSNLRSNGQAQSAREIGVENGAEEQSVYVLQDSDIEQSAQWKRIRANAEENGARVVLYAGDLRVYNPLSKTYSKVEGIHQVDAEGNVTYYIKVDKRTRDGEQIYLHETFHNIVHNNPDLMPYLMKALESEYGRQEIAALVNDYIEVYDGIYGTFEDGMTEAQQEALVMRYMEEVFADVYGDIRRGKYRTTAAQKIMRDQTDAVQRAAQNRKGMENKKAPPKQSFSKAENNTGYAERNLTEDESVYSYDFLIRQDDMFVTKLPEVPAIRNNDGRISRENVAEMGLDNARTVGHEENGKIFVKNNYTGKNLQITASAIRHSLGGDGKRMLTNARLGAVVGELAKNAIPVNALHNTAKNASGTYAMAAYAQDSQERNFVAILTVEQYETKISAIEIFDVLHALNGRQKNSSRADTKSQGVNPSTAAKISIAEFLRIVNTTHQSILSKNVLDVLNEEKSRNGYYADRTKFSVENDAQEDFIEQAIDKEKRVLEERRAAVELTEEEQQREREREAVAEKKRLNAQRVKSSALKNQIKRTQEELAIQRATIRQLKKDGLLTKETKEAIEARMEDIKETLEIQKEVLEEKLKEERAAESERKKKKREQQERVEQGRISKRETTKKLLTLFSAPMGTKTDMKVFVEDFLDRLMRSGSLTDADRKELFMGLFYNGEEIIEKDDYFRGVREEVKEGRIYVPESVREEFGDDWKHFRDKAWGCRIHLTNLESDMGINVWTEVLNEHFGGFDASADLKSQLEQIVEMAEEGKDEHISLAEMMERNRNNFGWSVEEQMADLEDKMEHILIGFAEKVELEIRLTERRAAEIAEDRERQKEALRRKKEEREGLEARTKLMGMINKLSRYQKKASPEFKKLIGEVLKGIDIVARRISPRGLEDLQELKRRYFEAKEKNGKNFLRHEKIEERIARLDEMQVDDMSFDKVVELSRVICNLVNAVENSKRAFTLDRQKTVDQLGKGAFNILKRVKGCGEGVLRKWFHSHLDGKRFFAMLGDWDDDSVWAKMGEALSNGELRMMNYQMRATRIFDEFFSKKENREWLKEAAGENAKWLKYRTWQMSVNENGNGVMVEGEIEITPMMRVALLMHSKNDQNLRHIAYGGIHIPDKKLYMKGKLGDAYARGTNAVLSPSEVRAIVAECSEQEKEFAKLLDVYYNQLSRECINEVSMQADGFERACVTNYYPIKSQKTLFDHVNEYLSYDFNVENTPSVVKERLPWAKTRIELVDATTTLTSHIDSISKYYGYTMPVRDVTAILSYEWRDNEGIVRGSVNETLLKKWGKDAEAYIDKLLADLQMTKSEGDILSDFLAKLRGNYAGAVISFNPSSVLKQLASLPAAQPYLKSGALLHGMVSKADVSTLEKYSALYWYRNQGNTTTELGDVMKKKEFGDTIPLLFQTTQKMDSFVTRRLLAACEWRIQEDMGLAPGSKEEVEAGTDQYWREVAKLFNKVVLNTQSNSSMMERPKMTRANSGNISRFLTMFKTDAFQQFGMLTEAKGKLRAAKLKYKASQTAQNKADLNKARAFAARTVTGILTGQVWSAVVVYLMALLKQKDKKYRDEEENFSWSNLWWELGKDVIGGLAGLTVGAETVYSAILAAVGEESWWGMGVDALEIVSDTAQGIVNLTSTLKDGDWHSGRGAIKDLAFTLAKGAGIPAQNMETYIMSIVRWAAPEWSEQYENWFEETTKDSLSEESKFTIQAAIGVVLDNRVEGLTDEVKEELARLYMAGGKVAVPGAIPTNISYTVTLAEKEKEKFLEDQKENISNGLLELEQTGVNDYSVNVTMTKEQRENFLEDWAEVVLRGLPDLLSQEDYLEADDEGKAELVGKLYQYATQIAKNAVVPEKKVDKWVQDGLNAEDEGIPLAEYIAFRVDLSDITGKDDTGETVTGLKAQRAMDLLEAMGWTDKQEEKVYLDVIASDRKRETEQALRAAGLSWEITNDVVVMTGNKWGKMDAIIKCNASEKVKYAAIAVFASDKEKNLLRTGQEFGVSLKLYAEVMNNADANGNGNVDSKEVGEYLRYMDLTWQEKAYLWQMICDGKDGKNNPFSTYFGEQFYHAAHINDPPEE